MLESRTGGNLVLAIAWREIMSIYWFKPVLMRQGAGDCGRGVSMRQHLTTGATATLMRPLPRDEAANLE